MNGMASEGSPKSQWLGLEKYIQLGLTIPAATVVGWLLGGFLQRWLHHDWLPTAGMIFGTVAGLVYFIQVAWSAEKEM